MSQQKQMTGGDGVRVESRAKVPYQFSSTSLKKLPIPEIFERPNLEGLFLAWLPRQMKRQTEFCSFLRIKF